MRELIKNLLRENLNKQSYRDWMNNMPIKSKYQRWSLEHSDKANKYWALYSHLYDKIFAPLRTSDELKIVQLIIPSQLENKEALEAFKMFSMYKEDVLNGLIQEVTSLKSNII